MTIGSYVPAFRVIGISLVIRILRHGVEDMESRVLVQNGRSPRMDVEQSGGNAVFCMVAAVSRT